MLVILNGLQNLKIVNIDGIDDRLKAQGYFDKPDFKDWRNGFGKKRKKKTTLRSLMGDIKYLSK